MVHGLITPVTTMRWQRSEEAVLRGQAGRNRLRDGNLTFANLGNVTIAKDSVHCCFSTYINRNKMDVVGYTDVKRADVYWSSTNH
jgi:hypothetical protein